MRESAYTLYVATEDGESVGAGLSALLAEETYAPEGGRSQVGWWRGGAPGWTVLETFPPELMLDRPTGSREPRLAALARRLECDVVYLAIHEGKEVLLVEADRRGRWGATGSAELSIRGANARDRDDPRACRDGGVLRFVVVDASAPLQA
ncbi:MAG: hypothetical protein M3Y87_29055, partial [Myxococcota bacterium]|nr:hypothetical protein [Myxococcota bacterium]